MGPLHGLKVLEFPAIGPVPFCAMLLADLGATVLRVDREEDAGLGIERPRRFQISHRGRKVLKLDLKKPQTLKLAKVLIERTDVLIEGFRPSVMERLGLGPEVCLGINPRLIYGRMTGWGQTGPLAASAGHDINYIALTGALDSIGRRDQPPTPPLNLVGDFGGGSLYLALGILSALWERHSSGRGQIVDAAIIDGTLWLLSGHIGMVAAGLSKGQRGANMLDSGSPFYDVYACADGRWFAVGALEDKFFAQLVAKVGLDAEIALQQKRDDWPSLRSALKEAFSKKDAEAWRAVFDGTDCCATIVNSLVETFADPHLAARKSFIELDGVIQPAPALRFSRSAPGTPRAPSAQNTADEALADWVDPETLQSLKENGAWKA
ncbi:CaiB/BaiF CoA-transferase family protein [Bradyrhizobium sp. CCH5-F6]|mgnify:CR=1 FL=1|jgi:crotonobetainyl-CoA:carnitine CoA-transferase CaiB-like acyl-CoA transferase|uniref:CaiB/BaiF CoA transferase family protein n=1 Tax=unclassified Bradyrhizobium TaxID=2631580 RepID=UPI00076A0583|nr:CaiB/BaiF CoA-transferase family protein [Bradyrhizobium sp. CCH5-F6]